MKIRPVILCGGSGTRLWTDKNTINQSSLLILEIGHYSAKL